MTDLEALARETEREIYEGQMGAATLLELFLRVRREALEEAAKVNEERANRAYLSTEPMYAIRKGLLHAADDIRALLSEGEVTT